MSRIKQHLTSSENLTWAWKKAQWLYRTADGPVDLAEVAAFELDLERQLKLIGTKFLNLSYRLRPIILLPQPKKPKDDGKARLRQSFQVSVRDQVAWIALVNVIGPLLDSKMPAWSYGHRLYKAAWYEEQAEGGLRLELGPYRHTSGNLFRRFKHSWPLFRRHISLSARLMVNALEDEEQLDDSEKSALNYTDKPRYLESTYWEPVRSPKLYYASIDLEKFYPSITQSAITSALKLYLDDFTSDEWLRILVTRLLDFRVGSTGSHLLSDPVVEPQTNVGPLQGIPTGLMVAGFLSNVAMLPLDILTDRRLQRNRRLAHFRFVDDHAILAYDSNELRAWILQYEKSLSRLRIGPKLSQDKFDPPILAKALEVEADDDTLAQLNSDSEIDGSHPSRLMTKTLALVSELAGTDFDILSDDSRNERLGKLEWLLLADLSDREIRSDTRAAFAASRLASLIPIAFSPSVQLLEMWRELSRLKQATSNTQSPVQAEKLKELKDLVNQLQIRELNTYLGRAKYYFSMMLRAFHDHPYKPRLFLRVLEFCRNTGHDGTVDVLNWIATHLDDDYWPLAAYLRPLAVQAIGKHIATAAFDLNDTRLLYRQRIAARHYLRSIIKSETRRLLGVMIEADGLQDVGSICARSCFHATLAAAVDALHRNGRRPALHSGLEKLAHEIRVPALTDSSEYWIQKTGSSIGVWCQWLDQLLNFSGSDPSPVWIATAPTHDPRHRLDWQSLRKGPRHLPPNQAEFLQQRGFGYLKVIDAGWLLEQISSPNPIDLNALERNPRVVSRLRSHLRELKKEPTRISVYEWVTYLQGQGTPNGHDPRGSEWTALEILKQLLGRIREFPGLNIAALDELHPSNILLPKAWLSDTPPDTHLYLRWTWEAWRHEIREHKRPAELAKSLIEDYRRRPPQLIHDEDLNSLWRARLRTCGLLLLGLVARDFGLPAHWNIWGLERDTAGFVRRTLEEIPLSSHSHAIIEAALLPRSAETALIRSSPWAFFGAKPVALINDTTTDPPLIRDLDELWERLDAAQKILETRQISVLDHAPRQLIPLNVVQLKNAAVELMNQEPDE